MKSDKKKPKTETIKERSIYVYLPSKEMTNKWKESADKAGISISKFVIEHVYNSLQQQEEDDFIPKAKLLDELKKVHDENKALLEKVKDRDNLIDRLEKEIKELVKTSQTFRVDLIYIVKISKEVEPFRIMTNYGDFIETSSN